MASLVNPRRQHYTDLLNSKRRNLDKIYSKTPFSTITSRQVKRRLERLSYEELLKMKAIKDKRDAILYKRNARVNRKLEEEQKKIIEQSSVS